MKQIFSKIKVTRFMLAVSLVVLTFLFNSCKDDFFELNKPSWLGESIYDQLEGGYTDVNGTTHSFKTYVRLIDDIGYKEVLQKTGSKTIFAYNDDAFTRFFKSNPWGVSSFEQLTLAQKKILLNSSMINNAYLVELLSNIEGPVEGQALRRLSALSVLDTIGYEKGEALAVGNTNWDFYRNTGLRLMKDNTPIPMLHFLQRHMDNNGITDEDFSIVFNGMPRQKNDAHIYGQKIVARDITCKNGYVNILQDVLLPPVNMAEAIRTNPKLTIFSAILERFSSPFHSPTAEKEFKALHPDFTDSIFVKRYFAERSSAGILTVDNITNSKGQRPEAVLEFDPGWNTYATPSTSSNMQTDMAAIFVPTDEALTSYFKAGAGKILMERYHSIENIPTNILVELVRNLMKPSFIGSLPHRFKEVLNDGRLSMGIEKDHIDSVMVCSNGAVYVTNQVYAPVTYLAVTAPLLYNDNMKLFNWAIANCPDGVSNFKAYLISMDSRYSFMVPSDYGSPANDSIGNGMFYIDPVSLGKKQAEVFRFWYNQKAKTVAATAYAYSPADGAIGDSIRAVSAEEVKNRLIDLLDYHIVVGDIESGRKFYRTKGGGQIKINGSDVGMKISGGGDIELSVHPSVTNVYNQMNGGGNGKTYMLTTPLQQSTKSVYKILSENPEFSEFYKLLLGNDLATAEEQKKYGIFYKDLNSVGLDLNVKFFNTFHYTVYAPKNEAVLKAIQDGLPTWDVIKAQTDQAKKNLLTSYLVNFLRYHFQDNSVYIDGEAGAATPYETAAYTLSGDKSYYKLFTKLTTDGLVLAANESDLVSNPVRVTNTPELRNIMAREYKFNKGDLATATAISTSSYAVIHQIDNVLLYDKNLLNIMKDLTGKSSVRYKSRSVK